MVVYVCLSNGRIPTLQVILSSCTIYELYIGQMLFFLKALALLVPVLLSYLVPESSVLTLSGPVDLDLLSSSH